MLHRRNLSPEEITIFEELPVTSIARTVSDLLEAGKPDRSCETGSRSRLRCLHVPGEAWQTVEVGLGPSSQGDVDFVEPRVLGLAELGLPVTSPVRCLGLAEQVAQKLHACTAPFSIEMPGSPDYRHTSGATRLVFAERGTHLFPPVFSMPAERCWK